MADSTTMEDFERFRLCKCGALTRKGGRYCLKCHAKAQSRHRKANPLTGEALRRSITRAKSHVYLKRGKLERRPCSVCRGPAQMHHPDYSDAMNVEWLCREHHLEHHASDHSAGMTMSEVLKNFQNRKLVGI